MNRKNIYLVADLKKNNLKAIKKYSKLGIGFIQYRDKKSSDKNFIKNANKIHRYIKKSKTKLIINDRFHLLDKIKCYGFHIGQNDGDHEFLRKKYANLKIGISVSNYEEAKKALKAGADFLGVGAMFPTKTKQDAKIISLNTLKEINTLTKNVIIIGGLNDVNLKKIPKEYFKIAAFSSYLLNVIEHEHVLKSIEDIWNFKL